MKRSIYSELIKWKKDASHKPLVLNGARQVGKTYILKAFGNREYKNMAYINLDKDKIAGTIFETDYDVKRIIRTISAHTGTDILPHDTLVFIDEIQESPRALECLKYFKEDAPEYDIAVAGSLLGISIHKDQSFPVGQVNIMQMYPMTFDEFLTATGNEHLRALLQECDWQVISSLSAQYIELLRQYYYVGGMPEVVADYIAGKGLKAIREKQKEILTGYRKDFSKHAPATQVPRINMIWDSIPAQLAKDNKKFIYGAVKRSSRAKDFEIAIQWLVDAGLAYRIQRVTKIEMPLKFYEEMDVFKLFMLDVGLMGAMTDAPANKILMGNDIFKEYKGAFTELYVMNQLVTNGVPVFYHSTNESLIEIDFAVQLEDRVVPIEVKAEENIYSKSLKTYIQNNPHLKGLRVSMKNYIDQGWMENVPLYAISDYLKKQ